MTTQLPGDGTPTGQARLVLYTRDGCHLCDDARDLLRPLAESLGEPLVEVDVDTGPDSEELVRRYGEYVPVVTVDGVQQGFWRVDPERVRRALAGGTA